MIIKLNLTHWNPQIQYIRKLESSKWIETDSWNTLVLLRYDHKQKHILLEFYVNSEHKVAHSCEVERKLYTLLNEITQKWKVRYVQVFSSPESVLCGTTFCCISSCNSFGVCLDQLWPPRVTLVAECLWMSVFRSCRSIAALAVCLGSSCVWKVNICPSLRSLQTPAGCPVFVSIHLPVQPPPCLTGGVHAVQTHHRIFHLGHKRRCPHVLSQTETGLVFCLTLFRREQVSAVLGTDSSPELWTSAAHPQSPSAQSQFRWTSVSR